jgi:hypothetical protein
MADMNVANDLAVCRACGQVHKLSSLVQAAELEQGLDFARPPAGAWYRDTGLGAVVGATHRSLGTALGLLAFSLFWNGIVSVFVFLAVSSTLYLLHVPRPGWFPSPQMNGSDMGVGMTIFLWLFLTPFILIGLAMLAGFFSALGGRTEATIQNGQGVLYTGIGALGWHRRFNPQFVKEVRIDDRRWRDSDGDARRSKQIVIEMVAGKPIKFGSMLRDDRMKFVAAAVRKALQPWISQNTTQSG